MNQVQLIVHPNIANLQNAARNIAKGFLCPQSKNGSVCLCKNCIAINEKRSAHVLHIPARSSYTRESIESIHTTTLHARGQDEPLFIILENPEFLIPAAANSLLKTLEEPPANVYFLLLSQNATNILPTIRSRAAVNLLDEEGFLQPENTHDLVAIFLNICNGSTPTGAQIEAVLQKKCPDASESMQIFDQIIMMYAQQPAGYAEHVLDMLYALRAQPPAPGSSKIFWRTAFLNILSLH
jgi:hypothetical protein